MINVAEIGAAGVWDASDTLVLKPPALSQAGDLLLACIMESDDATTMAAPTGWTELVDSSNAPDMVAIRLYTFPVTAADLPASWDFVSSAPSAGEAIGQIMALRNTDPDSAVGASIATAALAAGATHTTAAITLELYNSLGLIAIAMNDNSGWAAVTAGLTERIDLAGTAEGLAVYTLQQDATGTTGAKVLTPPNAGLPSMYTFWEFHSVAPDTPKALTVGPGTLPGGRGIV